MPTPAFAPVDNPESDCVRAVVVEEGAIEEVIVDDTTEVVAIVEEFVGNGENEDDVEVLRAASVCAIVYLVPLADAVQQASESPQHQVEELVVPSHGVTMISFTA